MPEVFPFRAVQYAGGAGDVSAQVAPPYDVLDAKAKAALLDRDGSNVVGIDLPHVPAKELGPPEAYSGAAERYRAMLADGTLAQRDAPAMFAYRQTFDFQGKTHKRTGMAATVEVVDFGEREGGGVLAHEETFSGPKADRKALMDATRAQLSPIFSMHHDATGAATKLLQKITTDRAPDMTARTDDGVLHEVWTITDSAEINAYRDALAGEDLFIADGHHRYTTGLNYLRSLEEKGNVPADHPARRCMMVIVGMSNPGLVIGQTHRVLGGMAHYSIEKFQEEAEGVLDVQAIGNDPRGIEAEIARIGAQDERAVVGLFDFATGLAFAALPLVDDPLEDDFPCKSKAWRMLDVTLVQHVVVEQICKPHLNDGNDVKWAFPHSMQEVLEIGKGTETGAGGGAGFAQLAVIVRPTPLDAVRDVCLAGDLMPQKSTFFYPKLATGLFINPLE